MSAKPVVEDVPEDEEMDFDEDEMDMDDGGDLLDALSQMFTTEEGETVAIDRVPVVVGIEPG